MPWWAWMISGIVLLCAELFVPVDLFLIFIGTAGIVTGTAVYYELLGPEWLQWTACAVLSLALLAGVRPQLLARIHKDSVKAKSDLVGNQVEVFENIAPGETGRGGIRGSTWQVENAGQGMLAKGKRYTISRTDGVKLVVSAE